MTSLQLVLRLVQQMPGAYLWTALLQVARFLVILVPAWVAREFFTVLAQPEPRDLVIWALALAVVAATALRVGVIIAAVRQEFTTSLSSAAVVRDNILQVLFDLPDGRALPKPPGEIVNRLLTDVGLVSEFTRFSFFLVGGGITAMASLALMASIAPFITAFTILPVVGAGLVVAYPGRQRGWLARERRASDGAVHGANVEAFTAVKLLQSGRAETRVADRFKKLSAQRRQSALRETMLRDVVVNSVFENFRIVTIGFILFFTGAAMSQGTFSVADLVFFIALLFPLGDFTVQLSRQLAIYQQLKVSHERLRELLPQGEAGRMTDFVPNYLKSDPAKPAPIARSPEDTLETLEVRGLSSALEGRTGVAGIDLMLRRGTFTAVTGSVGAGKTTLLKSLLGISPRSAGDILWNGRPVENLRRHFEPPRASYVAQAPVLFSDTVRQDILLGRDSVASSIEELVREAELGPDIAQWTHGLDTQIGAFGVRLSGGQAQRVALARALANDPQLLVLDDLSSALDPETEEQLWQRLSDRSRRRTCLFVTHRRLGLSRADRIVVLKDGVKIAEGTLSELLQSCDEMKAIWDTEADDTARA